MAIIYNKKCTVVFNASKKEFTHLEEDLSFIYFFFFLNRRKQKLCGLQNFSTLVVTESLRTLTF